jgi:hypothetical protein
VALILAFDPGGGQATAIGRLVRELDEHDVVSVESCADAIAAVERRAPDLVLLPALLPEAEEAELRSRLDAASGRVLTLTLPLLASEDAAPAGRLARWVGRFGGPADRSTTTACDPSVFAAQIREYLAAEPGSTPRETGPPEAGRLTGGLPPERRAQLLAAASKAAAWVRARRGEEPESATARDIEVEPALPRAIPRQEETPEPAPIEPPAPPRAPETVWQRPAVAERPPRMPASEREAAQEEKGPVAIAAPASSSGVRPRQMWDRDQEAPQAETAWVSVGTASDPAGMRSLEDGTLSTVEPIGAWAPEETPDRPADESRIPRAVLALRVPATRWLPRVAVLGVLVILAAAGRAYWPALSVSLTDGTAVLDSNPAGSQVFIDGRAAGTTPLTVRVSAGWHRVEFRDGALSRTRDVAVVARGRVVERMDWTEKPAGALEVTSDPTGARVLVDGEARGSTPLKIDGLAVGTHLLVIESAAGTVRQPVTIAAGETAQVTELISSGWLAAFSPFDIEISEQNRPISLDERGRAMLAPGSHELRFRNREFGYDEVRRIEIKPSATTALTLVPPPTAISVTATEPADVLIDGARIGETPISDVPVSLGTREIVVRTAAGNERRFVVPATTQPIRLDVDFSKPQP